MIETMMIPDYDEHIIQPHKHQCHHMAITNASSSAFTTRQNNSITIRISASNEWIEMWL